MTRSRIKPLRPGLVGRWPFPEPPPRAQSRVGRCDGRAGDEVELLAVLHVAPALDDDVGVRLEQAEQFFTRRHRLAVQHPAQLSWQVVAAFSRNGASRRRAAPMAARCRRRFRLQGLTQLASSSVPAIIIVTDNCRSACWAEASVGRFAAVTPAGECLQSALYRQCRRWQPHVRHDLRLVVTPLVAVC
jgi:hypothetical protein